MDSVMSWGVTGISTVMSGMILFLLKRFFDRQQQKEVQRDTDKSKDTALILRSLNALGKLTIANSIALRDGKTNGEMSAALAEYEKVEHEMYEHLIEHHSVYQ